MSHVTCCDHFNQSWMSHSSCICFKFYVRVHIVSCDTIQHDMMWNRIRLCSHGTDVHLGLTFALSHQFT